MLEGFRVCAYCKHKKFHERGPKCGVTGGFITADELLFHTKCSAWAMAQGGKQRPWTDDTVSQLLLGEG